VAAPKKKAKVKEETDEKSKEVTPETWTQKATGLLSNILSGASAARTASIKLSNMEYASELANQLLSHAAKMEGLYQTMSKSISDKDDEKVMKRHVQEANILEEFGNKAQAGPKPFLTSSNLFLIAGLKVERKISIEQWLYRVLNSIFKVKTPSSTHIPSSTLAPQPL